MSIYAQAPLLDDLTGDQVAVRGGYLESFPKSIVPDSGLPKYTALVATKDFKVSTPEHVNWNGCSVDEEKRR